LGGERGGLAIEGFDLGNSPAEYTRDVVAGRSVVLTTTNGTKALLHSRQASSIVLAAFVNLSAVCDHLLEIARRTGIDVICAGTDSHITREDVLLAGAIAERLADAADWQLDDAAALARDAWTAVWRDAADSARHARLTAALGASRGGRNLIAIGMDRDLETAAQIDRFNIVPKFDSSTGAVTIL
jgi:2-phosphosulfolactate phosphatase